MNGKFAHKKQAEARDYSTDGARSIAHGRRAKRRDLLRPAGPLSFELATSQQRHLEPNIHRPCLIHPKNQKVFKILCHIESFNICMKH
jgi:hypothetical protein